MRAQTNYIVGPQDVLLITLYDDPAMSGKFVVEADGTFTYPLIGRLKAGGLTLREVEAELRKRLADGYFLNPQVAVSVETYRSQRVFVVGEVRLPATYNLTGEMTLIEVLSRAGSVTAQAGPEVLIVRPAHPQPNGHPLLPNQDGESEVIRVDIKEVQSGALKQNLALRDGDTIYVPRAETIYVFGYVKSPGAYPLQDKKTTVMQALSLAGGVSDRGSTRRIRIIRTVKGEKKEFDVKLDDLVLPGDTIVVRERFF